MFGWESGSSPSGGYDDDGLERSGSSELEGAEGAQGRGCVHALASTQHTSH